MKEYIKGKKKVRIQQVDDFNVRFDFWDNGTHTHIIADMGQYLPFLNYLKTYWLHV